MSAAELTKVGKGASMVVKTAINVLDMLEVLTGKLDPLTKLPIVGETVSDIQDTVSMINDYFKGEYRNIPVKVLLGCAAIAVYLALPDDIIPDDIPVIGVIDDAFVIKLILGTCVSKELDTYRLWKIQQIN